jgi:formate hydrogenlyase subunit 5
MSEPTVETNNTLFAKLCRDYFSAETARETYLPVSEEEFRDLVPLLPGAGVLLIGLFAVENFAGKSGFTLFYVLEKRGSRNIVVLQLSLPNSLATSIAEYFPSAGWFEREIRDGFGIEFHNAFDKRRLFLHEPYPADFHPLRKSFKNQALTGNQKIAVSALTYPFKEIEGNGVYQVLVGPVHAGIIEPGHFHFNVIGETVINLEIRLFYKHRGIEKLAEGKTPLQCVTIAETISGDESVANATAFCGAVERISGIKVPERAWCLRTIMLELERIYSHLGDLAGMIVDVAFAVGASEFSTLREEIFQYNEILTGSRFMKGMVCPGGLKKEIRTKNLLALSDYLEVFARRFKKAVDFVHRLDSVIDRLETTGIIRPELIQPLNITGPAARASGLKIDTRVDHPYGIYPALGIHPRIAPNGDVLCRFDVKTMEVLDSIYIIQKLVADIGDVRGSEVCGGTEINDGYALSLVEAPRGQSLHWVYIQNGVIDRYKVRTASFCNWQVIEHAVIGNIVPDFPLINKSLNLSYAGTDL